MTYGIELYYPLIAGLIVLLFSIALIAGVIFLVIKLAGANPSGGETRHHQSDDDPYASYDKTRASQTKFCSNCGSQVEAHQVVCLNCGASVKPSSVTGTMSSRQLAGGLLGIFLGVWGVHNFYLGYTQKAVAQLLLGTLGAFFIVGPVISAIWGLIEGVFILTGEINQDGQGRPI